jgi:hypothetical protein
MDDAAGDASIVFALRPGMDHRKMRLDRRPLLIAEPEIVRHESSPPDELESQCDVQFNWVRTLGLDHPETAQDKARIAQQEADRGVYQGSRTITDLEKPLK